MTKTIAAALVISLFAAGSALADPAAYTWTGMGTNVSGSSKSSSPK